MALKCRLNYTIKIILAPRNMGTPVQGTPLCRGGGDITEMKNSYYGFLLWFITDINEFYYRYYGTFLEDFIDSESRHQKCLKTLMFEKTLEKSS